MDGDTITTPAPTKKRSLVLDAVDLAERAGATFAQAFLATITVNETGFTEVDAVKVGAIAGAYSVAKFLLVKANAYLKTP